MWRGLALLAVVLAAACAPRVTRAVCVEDCQVTNRYCIYWAGVNEEIDRCHRNVRRCMDHCPTW
jgi:hypothetical protein